MYNSLELRVVLPPPGTIIFQRTTKQIGNHIPIVPRYATKCIKKLVFVAARQGPGTSVDWCPKPYDQLKRFWPAVWTQFSNLETVRLHFDDERYLQEVSEFDYESFKGLVKINKLRRVAIEMHVQDKFLSHAWQIKTLAGMLSAYLRAEAQLLQKSIDVTIDLTWVHRTKDGTPWNFKI